MRKLLIFQLKIQGARLMLLFIGSLLGIALTQGIMIKRYPEIDVIGFIQGAPLNDQTEGDTTLLMSLVLFCSNFLWDGYCMMVFKPISEHLHHWLLPASPKQKFASCLLVNGIAIAISCVLIIYVADWVRPLLAKILSVDVTGHTGWASALVVHYFRWYVIAYYLWAITGSYYLSTRIKPSVFTEYLPSLLLAPGVIAFMVNPQWPYWMNYLGILFLAGIIINISLTYRRFLNLDIRLKPNPKTV